MKPNKGFITVLMMVLISISLSTFSRAAFDTFSDVPNDSPFHESIFYLAERGIVCGEGNGRYVPDACELTGFTPGTALVFENAIERLYYSDSYRIGNATLPQSRVRAKLRRLDGMILREAERKLRENQEQNVKNSTAYTMAVLFNCIAESESDLMVDPYLNALSSTA